jgi:hypothetical protein
MSRLSIVIPFQFDESSFEQTLLSVLEDRPADTQIVVAHNGTYRDPFDLGDEVEFATARSSNLVDLVRDAFPATSAPVVQLLATGMTMGASDAEIALQAFEASDVGAVSPVTECGASGKFVHAGWADVPGRLAEPIDDSQSLSELDADSLHGGYLYNSFFRRQLLSDLLDAVAPALNEASEVAYAFACLMRGTGWRTLHVADCRLQVHDLDLVFDESDYSRGQRLGALRQVLLPQQHGFGWASLLREALLGGSSLGEMFGMLNRNAMRSLASRLVDAECVRPPADSEPVYVQPPSYRRAA